MPFLVLNLASNRFRYLVLQFHLISATYDCETITIIKHYLQFSHVIFFPYMISPSEIRAAQSHSAQGTGLAGTAAEACDSPFNQ